MAELVSGTEQNDWNLAASEQLEVNVAATSYTVLASALVQIEVQLGNAGNTLHASGGIVAVTAKITEVDTGDKCLMPQKQMNVVAGTDFVKVVCDSFWAKVGSTIEVHAKSSNAGDDSVGGKAWLIDVTPAGGSGASAAEVVTALMAHTGFTAGGTMAYDDLLKLLAGLVAGTWRAKPADSTKQELLDADDDASILLTQTLSASTPYKEVNIT